MIRGISLVLFSIKASSAQSLFDLAPTADEGEPLPITWTAGGTNFGYDDKIAAHNPTQQQKSYFFGDSLTDTGNIARELGGGLGNGYPGSFFSNGPTWAKYLIPSVQTAPQGDEIPSGAIDFSHGISTTKIIKDFQIDELLTNFAPALTPTDRAFLWGGGNDFLAAFRSEPPPTMESLATVANAALLNLTASADSLVNTHGFQNLVVFGLVDVTKAPSISGFDSEGARISEEFNRQLQSNLFNLPGRAHIIWIDSNALLTRAIDRPDAFGLTNVTESAAPDAVSGIPSPLSAEEQAGYLFYDHIHPTTSFHQTLATFVAHHLSSENAAQDSHLLTDAALSLDDSFGFEITDLGKGNSRLGLNTSTFENESGARRRNTRSFRIGVDHALTENILIGGEFLYSDGDSGHSNLETFGFRLDATLQGFFRSYQWELGSGIGSLSGDLKRDFKVGDLQAKSEQSAQIYTLHAALRNERLTIANRPAYWELGLKQRFVHRDQATESGAASLNLRYQSDTLSTTIANLEVGIELTPTIQFELALNPVISHSGGNFKVSQTSGFGTFLIQDATGYDVHTAQATLRADLSNNAKLTLNLLGGSDQTWSAGLGISLDF